jgi:hypothetical protein
VGWSWAYLGAKQHGLLRFLGLELANDDAHVVGDQLRCGQRRQHAATHRRPFGMVLRLALLPPGDSLKHADVGPLRLVGALGPLEGLGREVEVLLGLDVVRLDHGQVVVGIAFVVMAEVAAVLVEEREQVLRASGERVECLGRQSVALVLANEPVLES